MIRKERGRFMKRMILLVFILSIVNSVFCQDFSRIIEVKNPRMNGPDIKKMQTVLINYGFKELGEIDGYYGPLTEAVIKNIQYFLGFEQNGKVNKMMWDFLLDESNDVILKNINTIAKYNLNELRKESSPRMGYSTEGGQVDKYYMDNELKRINLVLAGEMGQVHYYFYYMNFNYYVMIKKDYRYPSHLFDILKDEKTFWAETIITYETYLEKDNILFQIIDGNFQRTDFNVVRIMEIIEGKNPNF
jgi:peptidoglycan hydrolase-like protein with peptidoglycan-binding domain